VIIKVYGNNRATIKSDLLSFFRCRYSIYYFLRLIASVDMFICTSLVNNANLPIKADMSNEMRHLLKIGNLPNQGTIALKLFTYYKP